ncbi:unnamed protein product [Prunus brigantina]
MVETRAQAKLKNKTVEMTSEALESTSPITVTETEHMVRSSASDPIMTDRTAESVQEQAVVEDLMDRQAYRIETSFMAAMDRFSSELRTLFQERMPVTSFVTPPRAGQRSQEHERFEPYGKSSSLRASARTQASGYGQRFQPPTNSWGQSQPAWVNSGLTRPSKVAYSPLHALAVSLGQSSPIHYTVQQGGPVHTLAVHTHPDPRNAPAASSQQYGQSNPTVSPLQARPQNDGQQVQQPIVAQQEAHPPSRGLRFKDVRRMIEDGLAQKRQEVPSEGTVTELARMSQATNESPRDYLQRFKTCRNWCRTNLPERRQDRRRRTGMGGSAGN